MDQPFSAPRLLSSGLRIWASNALPFSSIMLLLNLPILAVTTLLSDPSGAHLPERMALDFAARILSCIPTAVITLGTLQHLLGQRPEHVSNLKTVLSRLGRLLTVSLVQTVGASLGMLMFLVPGLIVATTWCLAVPVVVTEQNGVKESLERSRELTRGHRWSLFFVMFAFASANTLIIAMATDGLGLPRGHRTAEPVITAAWFVVHSLGAVVFAVAYRDLRAASQRRAEQPGALFTSTA
jgi:hypothetical protein